MNSQNESNIKSLLALIADIKYLDGFRSDVPSFKIWRQKTASTIERVYGRDSRMERDFEKICTELTSVAIPDHWTWSYAQTFLENIVEEIPKENNMKSKTNEVSGNKVFIVHGHDDISKWELKNILTSLGLEAIILHEQDDLGKTIIEKFEHYANECSFAFVLLTPDDTISGDSKVENQWRARQNVIMELGWFMSHLGRKNVVILHKGQVEIPSDILGVIYLKYISNVTEVSERIRVRLKGAGMIT